MASVGRRLFWIVLWFIAGALIANMIGAALALVYGQDFLASYGNLIVYPLMFIPAMAYNYKVSRSGKFFPDGMDLDNDNFYPLGFPKAAATVSLATIACAFVVEPSVFLLPEMPEFLKKALDNLLDAPLWVTLVSVSVFAPFFEEWLCRGTVLRGLLCRMKPAAAIALSALFFALIHLNPWQGIPAFALGCLFGWVYYKTGSLKLTMLMHCVNNTMSALLSRVPGLEDAETFMDIFSSNWHYMVVYVAFVIAIVLCVKLLGQVDEKALRSSESI
ncbi:MAG: CPBP family intramembrane metalloprotease [Bacteroidales bacterium]|nr:CPBP family intramembrane metalloprotease [Candidatus Cryptobacteroides caccocaballi]